MDRSTLEWFDVLAKALIWAAGVVLVLAVIGAVAIVGSDNSLPFAEDVQREGRGIAAIGAIAAGLVAAAVLSGLGAILRLLLAERVERLDEVAGPDRPGADREASGQGPAR